MQQFDFHAHTTFSDGKNTVEEMVEQAACFGFKQIGFSDHLIVHKNIKQTPSYQETKKTSHQSFFEMLGPCNKHAEEIRQAGKKYSIQTFVGYEVDYFIYDGWEQELRNFLSQIDYDYLISGNHFLSSESGENIFDIWRFSKYPEATPKDIKPYLKRHFETMQKAVQSKLFLFLAHMDYAQKIEAYFEADYQKEIDSLINALNQTNTACEISTKGIRKFGHFFPSENILKKLIKANIPIVISDDAHSTDELGSYFSQAEETLQRLKCQKRLTFRK